MPTSATFKPNLNIYYLNNVAIFNMAAKAVILNLFGYYYEYLLLV
jgi:hypothetical protein